MHKGNVYLLPRAPSQTQGDSEHALGLSSPDFLTRLSPTPCPSQTPPSFPSLRPPTLPAPLSCLPHPDYLFSAPTGRSQNPQLNLGLETGVKRGKRACHWRWSGKEGPTHPCACANQPDGLFLWARAPSLGPTRPWARTAAQAQPCGGTRRGRAWQSARNPEMEPTDRAATSCGQGARR